MLLRFALLLLAGLAAAPVFGGDSAQRKPDKLRLMAQATKPAPRAKQPAQKAPVPLDEEEEVVVLEFVREHHPELAELLTGLKQARPKEYQKALRDLSRARERLMQMQSGNAPRYDLELAIWKIETRVQLLAARLQMSDSQELREQLRAALDEQVDARIALLKLERDQFQERLKRAEAQLKKLEQERSATIDRQMEVLTRSPEARKDRPMKTAPVKPKTP